MSRAQVDGSGTTVNAGGTLDLNGFTLATSEALTLNGTGIANGGALSKPIKVSEADINEIGLLMGGIHGETAAPEVETADAA